VKWYTQLAKDNEKQREKFAQWLDQPPDPLDDIRTEDKDRVPIVKKKVMKRIKRKEEEKKQAFLASLSDAAKEGRTPSQ